MVQYAREASCHVSFACISFAHAFHPSAIGLNPLMALECPVCFEPYDAHDHEPCILPCQGAHDVCLQCALTLRAKGVAGGRALSYPVFAGGVAFACPVCRDLIHPGAKLNVNRALIASLQREVSREHELADLRAAIAKAKSVQMHASEAHAEPSVIRTKGSSKKLKRREREAAHIGWVCSRCGSLALVGLLVLDLVVVGACVFSWQARCTANVQRLSHELDKKNAMVALQQDQMAELRQQNDPSLSESAIRNALRDALEMHEFAYEYLTHLNYTHRWAVDRHSGYLDESWLQSA